MIENTVVLERKARDEARSLMRCADLDAVRFVRLSASIDHDSIGPDGSIELSSTWKAAGSLKGGMLRLVFDLKLNGGGAGSSVMGISARIEALYRLPEDESPSANQIKSFARANGMLNIWPYWREFVQSTTLRAGLAPLTIPLFRVVAAPQKAES